MTCSGGVWSCPLVSRGTDVDLHSEFVMFMINCTILIDPAPKIVGTNTFNLGGTWYLMSWYRYQRLPLSPPSFLAPNLRNVQRQNSAKSFNNLLASKVPIFQGSKVPRFKIPFFRNISDEPEKKFQLLKLHSTKSTSQM